jgi:hypothetical protein
VVGYIAVDDVDAHIEKIIEAGGKLWRPATDVPGMLRFAVMSDPQGRCHCSLYSQPRDVFAGSPMAVQCCIVQGRGARLFSLVGELVIRSENGPDTFQVALLCSFDQFVQFAH